MQGRSCAFLLRGVALVLPQPDHFTSSSAARSNPISPEELRLVPAGTPITSGLPGYVWAGGPEAGGAGGLVPTCKLTQCTVLLRCP